MTVLKCIFDDNYVKKTYILARSTLGHCKWHPGWEPLP